MSAHPSSPPHRSVRGPVIFEVTEREDLASWYEQMYRLEALVAIGEGKAAVDRIRRRVNAARTDPPSPQSLLRILSQYASILESTDALAEAEFIRTEALEIVTSSQVASRDVVDAFLGHGLLLVKMHNYDGAIAKLEETIRRAEALDEIKELDRQIILARATRGRAQALEALGEFTQASSALDALMHIKRHIRFIVFAASSSE